MQNQTDLKQPTMEEDKEEAHSTEETQEAQEIQEEALVTKGNGATFVRR